MSPVPAPTPSAAWPSAAADHGEQPSPHTPPSPPAPPPGSAPVWRPAPLTRSADRPPSVPPGPSAATLDEARFTRPSGSRPATLRPEGQSPPSPPSPSPSPSSYPSSSSPPSVPPASPPPIVGQVEASAARPKRRSPALIAAAAFTLGGVVGAGGFGLGQAFAENGTDNPNPVVNVAAPAVDSGAEATGSLPIPEATPIPLGAEPAADVARMLGPSVVQVETNLGQGSGVVYAEGLLLTNHHVIDGAEQVRIRTADGRVVEVEVLGSDPRNDIAVLSAAGGNLPVATIGSSAALEPGQLTVAIGSPFQLQQTITAGIVSSTNRPVPNAGGGLSAMIQTDAPINPGNSGGALANRNGELVGINASIRTDGTGNSNVGIGFAIPIDTAIEVADRIVAGDSLEPGVLGVTGEGQDSSVGVPIVEVSPGSGAEAAGLRTGDRVLTVDGAPVTSIGELTGLIQSHFSGDTVELEVRRGPSDLTLSAVLS